MSAQFKFTQLKLKDAVLIEPTVYGDERGSFADTYSRNEFKREGIEEEFVRDSFSRSKENVLRGLHLQKPPHPSSKLVQCVEGEVFDVIVDLRKNSVTYGKWESFTLSAENKKMLYIPEGFAHAFCVASPFATIAYKWSEFYHPEDYVGVRWNDPDLAIRWPVKNPIVSEKDKNLPFLKELGVIFP